LLFSSAVSNQYYINNIAANVRQIVVSSFAHRTGYNSVNRSKNQSAKPEPWYTKHHRDALTLPS